MEAPRGSDHGACPGAADNAHVEAVTCTPCWRSHYLLRGRWAVLTIAAQHGSPSPQQLLRYVPCWRMPHTGPCPDRGIAPVRSWPPAGQLHAVADRLRAGAVIAEQLVTPFPLRPWSTARLLRVATREPGTCWSCRLVIETLRRSRRFDDARMLYQTVHRHPMPGFVARLSPRIDAFYKETPVFAALLMSAPDAAPNRLM